ncbi:Planctomycete cytochrome C [Maioricimonas rarisocia]|uniref:Planctomycete cytochrome C n=1 Tax=Maioricimonas rarisocia TaxID=2528026 RepID=A0A517ZB74_9PLAN|nr:PSD1 and planctomycete cytochrome C domain-containing protein [Maioricimonas rarisocia]QDU39746.1 Planctomycete cytochrome C [Maioricimonas rarisocia]
MQQKRNNHRRHASILLTLTAISGLLTAAWSGVSNVVAEEAKQASEADASGLAFFESDVLPILETQCFRCHSGAEPKGGLDLTVREHILKGGDSGPAVDLKDPASSLLLEAVNYESYEMPPTGKLAPKQIAAISSWLKRGVPMPAHVEVADEGHGEPQVNETTKNHWAFRPVEQPPVPQPSAGGWVANPIDAFVLARLEEAGMQPNPEADRRTLVRRLYYDLLGLPPTPDQVRAFVEDDSPDAWERLVEELLDSPHYGEHWARYWLDLVRYAESNSFERDNPKPFVWKYRDYVIRSLNDDKPYDQFLLEQLAGDELDEVTPDTIIATGFYRLGLWDDEPADPLLAYYDGLDDIVATTSQGFLGLTMNCCRCHSHKLDPIPHEDYYRFLAFFRNVKHYGVRNEQSVYEASIRSIATPEEQRQFQEEQAAYEARVSELRGQLNAVEKLIRPHLKGGERDDFKRDSQRLQVIREHIGELITQEEFDRYARDRKEWTDLRNHPPTSAQQALCVKEDGAECPPTNVLLRGNPHVPGDVVEPGFPTVLSAPEPEIVPPAHGESSGRRRALAEWIVDDSNPLAARVMANRIWQWHFGRGLVRTPNNFGLQGEKPTHPELLDWLAAEFINRGWSIKSMHRLILNSNTYRMSSQAREEPLAADPQNDLLWRFDMRRLRAEEIRDSILAVNGSLTLEKMYGPSIYVKIPEAVLAGQSRPGQGWGNTPLPDRNRRSVYIHVKRSLPVPFLAAFDSADTDFTCPVRFATTQPTQALGMLNSDFLNEQAAEFAAFLNEQVPDGERRKQVQVALQRTLQRQPSEDEVQRGVDLIERLQTQHQLDDAKALKYFCLMALNLNEFIYLD